jgi:hypothetical protein
MLEKLLHITNKRSVLAFVFLCLSIWQASVFVLSLKNSQSNINTNLTEQESKKTSDETQNIPVFEVLTTHYVSVSLDFSPALLLSFTFLIFTFLITIVIGKANSRPIVPIPYLCKLFEHHIAPQAP